jgi:serine/threonine-protein kinase
VDPATPPALSEVILHALEKEPIKRFQTAEEFRAALAAIPDDRETVRVAAPVETPGTLLRPATTSLPPQAATPPITLPSPPDEAVPSPQSPEPIISRRSWYIALGTILAVALIVVLVVELPKFLVRHKGELRTESGEGALKGTGGPLSPSLALASGDMVLVAGGEALLGQDRHPVSVASFYIDKTEVTNRAYLMFCRETNHALPEGVEEAPSDYPVVDVTFYAARDFALWAKKRLPSALEWEKAARGAKGQIYPWGNELRFELANLPGNKAAAKDARLAAATAYPAGASPYGALNMLGNVWEWVDTPAEVPAGADFEKYQKRFFSSLVPPLSPTEPFYQVRGGSYLYAPRDPSVLIWDAMTIPARGFKPDIGFRCARDAER